MKKNIVIGALCFVIFVLSIALYQTNRENAAIRLELINTEINLEAAEAMNYEIP